MKIIKKINKRIEKAYDNSTFGVSDVIDKCIILWTLPFVFFITILIFITFPLWVIPYSLIERRR